MCGDGVMLNVNLTNNLLRLFWATEDLIQDLHGQVVTVWDGAFLAFVGILTCLNSLMLNYTTFTRKSILNTVHT